MKRIILIVAALFLVGGVSVPSTMAEFPGGHGGFRGRGPHVGHQPKFGMRGNRLNRFAGAFGTTSLGATMFDLYRTEQIPLPPYFSLHPPVYYHGIDYQRYGASPFAYPYTWWQQYGYGYNHGPPPVSATGPTAAPALLIENPHATREEDSEESANITDARVAGVVENPFVSEHSTAVRPVMIANRHVPVVTGAQQVAAP